MAPELRRDPLSHDWVIVATERGQRPHAAKPAGAPARDERAYDHGCPFCPGHEDRTPRPVLVRPATGPRRVRVVPNRYPIAAPADGVAAEPAIGLLAPQPAAGRHEVIVESPLHWRPIARMEPSEVEPVLWTYRERLRALSREPSVRYVVVFKNHGPAAGTSLLHPHSQLIALSTVPDRARRHRSIARDHRARTGRSLHEDVLAEELRAGARIVGESAHFVVHCPYASPSPFEVQVGPRTASPSFADAPDQALGELAVVLRDTLAALDRELSEPDFNYVLYSGLAGERVRWEWEMYGQSADVDVDAVDEDRRIVMRWPAYDGRAQTTVEWTFCPGPTTPPSSPSPTRASPATSKRSPGRRSARPEASPSCSPA